MGSYTGTARSVLCIYTPYNTCSFYFQNVLRRLDIYTVEL